MARDDGDTGGAVVRPEAPADVAAVAAVHRLAFGGDAEAALVNGLRAGGHAGVSVVAEARGAVVGHALLSRIWIEAAGGTVEALALAPVAVLPAHQRRGIGTRLVTSALRTAAGAGHRIAVVFGHPQYYPRFGFSAALAVPLAGPYGGGSAWMARVLVPGALAGVAGRVRYPPPFDAVAG